jgi:eukaryotic-like serine/threonine-protein kinase
LRRQVALKVLTEGVDRGTEGRARFMREARIAAAIKHPNVVNIFDIGVENQIPYLVMELLVGQDLETLLASHGALSEHTILDIIIPVVAGLVAVHDAGVVHRDLKPGNIFLSRGPNEEVEPKLLDFGISKATGGGDKLRLTSARGLLMGTPLYMSPEAMLGTDMTPASDQYSLGVMLYECATGINPFMSDSVAETARRVTTGQFTPISDQPIRPSRRLQAIIERTMSLDPNHRFRDMRALGQDLLQLAGQRTRITWGLTFGEVAAAARPQHMKEVDEEPIALARTRAPRRGGRAPLWPILAAAVVGVGSVAAFTWSTKQPQPVGTRVAPGDVPPAAAAAQVVAQRLQTAPLPPRTSSPLPVVTTPEPRAAAPSTPAPSPRVAHPAANAPLRVSTEKAQPTSATTRGPAEADVVADGNEDVAPQVDDDSRNREVRPRQRQRQRVEPRAEQPAPAAEAAPPPEAPDWIVERRRQKAHSSQTRFQTGTNAAPIFD